MTAGYLHITDISPILSLAMPFLRRLTHRTANSYWSFALEHTVLTSHLLSTAVGHDYGILDLPGLATAPNYMMQMVGPSGHLFNWGDGHAGTPATSVVFALATHHKNGKVEESDVEGRQRLWGMIELPGLAAYPSDFSLLCCILFVTSRVCSDRRRRCVRLFLSLRC